MFLLCEKVWRRTCLRVQTRFHLLPFRRMSLSKEEDVTTNCLIRGKKYPTIDSVKEMPRELFEFSNEALALAARSPDAHDAHQERLVREIMAVDNIDYGKACIKMKEIFRVNAESSKYLLLPMYAGLWSCGIAAVTCVPLVFDHTIAEAFANFVGAEREHELSANASIATVGEWSWDWMEPLIGTASFVILCLQLGRSAALSLALRPYYELVCSFRANSLADKYPQYTRSIVKDFGRSQPFGGTKFNPEKTHWWNAPSSGTTVLSNYRS
mmetsp:Transcript_17220/g.22392  ORF Transcript_17220/g.22392 Transcript_17220/m.22392 type:complete len:269 (-) Transcript_17220:328-1134(-)